MRASESHEVSVVARAAFAAAPARLWALVRDFNAMPLWNASVRSSRIENGPPERVGCLRVLDFGAGGVWTHRLTALSDADMLLRYEIVDGPQPAPLGLSHYRALMRVWPDAQRPQAACELEWRADFCTDNPQAMRERALQVFEAGFAGLRASVER